jgi:hypothetical protein
MVGTYFDFGADTFTVGAVKAFSAAITGLPSPIYVHCHVGWSADLFAQLHQVLIGAASTRSFYSATLALGWDFQSDKDVVWCSLTLYPPPPHHHHLWGGTFNQTRMWCTPPLSVAGLTGILTVSFCHRSRPAGGVGSICHWNGRTTHPPACHRKRFGQSHEQPISLSLSLSHRHARNMGWSAHTSMSALTLSQWAL